MSVWGRDGTAENAGQVEELLKLRMLLAQEQLGMAVKHLWLEIHDIQAHPEEPPRRGIMEGKLLTDFEMKFELFIKGLRT